MNSMLQTPVYSPRWYESLSGYFFRVAACGYLPASWFREALPGPGQRKVVESQPCLEIVSHCWKYSNMLAYQLSSLVNYPPKKLKALITVFYSEEDRETSELLAFIQQYSVENIAWNWQPLPKEKLFRRGIGRNMAARSSQADWLWFTDCDIVFHQGCLDSLAEQLTGRNDILLFPREERVTPMLAASDPMLQEGRTLQLVDISSECFSVKTRDCAKGAFQIVHGDVARAIGYCEKLVAYQTTSNQWCKCYEDRAYRWLLGTQGVPVDVNGVYQIRHIHKGRYKEGSLWSKVRSKIRRLQE